MKTVFIFLFATTFNLPIFAQFNPAAIDSIMVFVKGADFQMGSAIGKSDEKPIHTITLNDFYICKYEMTQALWQQIMGNQNQLKNYCALCPVYDVTIENIQSFLTKLNELTGKKFRLPTEAEWEYAACGGNISNRYKYSGSNNLEEVAWYAPNGNMETHPVGQKKSNELGLYDMSGNVWEICSDWYDKSYYKISPTNNPNNNIPSKYHVVRGGSWRSEEQRCQTHARNKDVRDHHISNGGFRLVREF